MIRFGISLHICSITYLTGQAQKKGMIINLLASGPHSILT